MQAVAAQELRIDGDEVRRAEGWAARNGWHAIISSCRRLESGRPSAGVGLFVRRHINVTTLPGCSTAPGSFELVPHFCVACHADFGIKGGLILVSAYFEVDKWSTVNAYRLFDISLALRGWNKPFAMAADWNCAPEALQDHGFLDYIPAKAVARPQGENCGTCRSAKGNYSNIDYWLTNLSIAGAMSEPQPVPGWPAAPHFPMEVKLDARAKATKFLMLSGPASFPKQAPDEDAVLTTTHDHVEVIQADVELGGDASAAQAQCRLDDLYGTFIEAAESELIDLYGVGAGLSAKHRGRASKVKYVWKQAGGPPSGPHPAAVPDARRARRLAQAAADGLQAGAVHRNDLKRLEKLVTTGAEQSYTSEVCRKVVALLRELLPVVRGFLDMDQAVFRNLCGSAASSTASLWPSTSPSTGAPQSQPCPSPPSPVTVPGLEEPGGPVASSEVPERPIGSGGQSAAQQLRGPAAEAAGRRAQFWNKPARLCAACPALRRRGAAAAAAQWLRSARPQPQQRHQARAARRRTRRNTCDRAARTGGAMTHYGPRGARGRRSEFTAPPLSGGGGEARGAWPKNGAGALSRASAPGAEQGCSSTASGKSIVVTV